VSAVTDERIVFVDVETTGLLDTPDALDRVRIYEFGAVWRNANGHIFQDHYWLDRFEIEASGVDLSPDGPNAEALRLGRFHTRHPQGDLADDHTRALPVFPEHEVAHFLSRDYAGARLAGSNVGSFDALLMQALIWRHDPGWRPNWSYRHLELCSWAAAVFGLPASPGLDTLLAHAGLSAFNTPDARHTALGDARMEMRLHVRGLDRLRVMGA
jgi:DNA polymerase III epsilon subunit-like protein